MEQNKQKARRSYLGAALGLYCPRCREGKLFQKPLSLNLKEITQMNKCCSECGQPTEIEVGFYYGTSYVSYMLTVAISVASAIAWWVIVGFSINDNRFVYWIVFNAFLLILMQPWMMRLARSFWLSWFVKYDPQWRETKPVNVNERVNNDQGNNW